MKYLTISAAGFACLAAPAIAEVVESSDAHFVTRSEAVVEAAPKAAWLALTTFGDWCDDKHTWSGDASNMSIMPQGGGCFCERLAEVESIVGAGLAGSALHITVLMAQPEKVLRMRGGLGPLQSEPVEGVLTIMLQADKAGRGTRIVWEYVVGGHMRFPVSTISKAVDGVMSQQLGRLADRLGRIDTPGVEPAAPAEDAGTEKPKTPDEVAAELDAMDMKGE